MPTVTAPLDKVPAYAAPKAGAALEPTVISRREPGAHDVLIEIRYTGICHSDIDQVRGDWGQGIYPMVPGHEIAGVVTAAGEGVTRHAVGDRVGVGCYVDSCGSCVNCAAGAEQFCARGMTSTYNAIGADGEPTRGGYSTHIVVNENHVLRIPDSIPLHRAAPLLCAGVTVYAPLRRWRVTRGTRVAIVGMGGLGHLGIRLARAMGAEVTLLSGSPRKQDDARRLGAHHFHTLPGPEAFTALAGSYDLILNTAPVGVDQDAHLSLLAVDGVLVHLGIADAPASVGPFSLVYGRKVVAGSMIGGLRETQETLDFCGAAEIGAEVELVDAARVNEAFAKVVAGEVRYRFVIDAATF
ncbi:MULTISPECIES: NAD(P)-dependent alcohol dehydrogenase [unclassified Streptomyces]|uniref:NAD(P)-dependent alcohol dehydrogenase n=1 Tax=unclassified Streptomyces TaxID=2593676 RepID=UPI002DD82F20|nr:MULTISPECIES: NAD(P)-dependent alcohol dehydrogenase [unclassified Streptomyces]WSA91207.1 NAD(P)-dependent alcohol dehydrogenase [Streptomyces sp. NBC_01795]WSB75532.1 NAD(P)-dependent alcohol dehydrogenase [Streptomyces sp. NBC_01775]WSS16184.1 NAD(P)-dependent alcohol dehydrogenase [Streptomyces sp. NBC_01186]WSS45003.1 NAD(P)-dependent alcohol dehydrogenase [Streptomyces sp. NBC_01187]